MKLWVVLHEVYLVGYLAFDPEERGKRYCQVSKGNHYGKSMLQILVPDPNISMDSYMALWMKAADRMAFQESIRCQLYKHSFLV